MTSTNVLDALAIDWYDATWPEDHQGLSALDLVPILGDDVVPARQAGYGWAYDVLREGEKRCTVMGGEGLRDHLKVSGWQSAEVAASLRRLVPGHSVSRVDSCVDLDGGPDLFAEVRASLFSHFGHKVKTGWQGSLDPGGVPAETAYVGSKKSEVLVRGYEKGKESPGLYPPNAVRLEVQVRPHKPDRKRYAATLSPADVWGMAKFSREALELLVGVTALAAPVRSERVSDLDGSVDALCHQYGRRMLELLARHDGDVEAWALDLLARIEG